MIRFQRTGRTNDPVFRISLLERERAAKAGRIVAQLGSYNPKTKHFTLDEAQTKEWLAKGAQLSDSVKNLLITKGIIEGKKVNVLPKKTPPKVEAPAEEVAAPAAESAATEPAAAEAAPEAAPADAAEESAAAAEELAAA